MCSDVGEWGFGGAGLDDQLPTREFALQHQGLEQRAIGSILILCGPGCRNLSHRNGSVVKYLRQLSAVNKRDVLRLDCGGGVVGQGGVEIQLRIAACELSRRKVQRSGGGVKPQVHAMWWGANAAVCQVAFSVGQGS